MTDEELLKIKIELEMMITSREGMMALNSYRQRANLAQAYDEEAFMDLYKDFGRLHEDLLSYSSVTEKEK